MGCRGHLVETVSGSELEHTPVAAETEEGATSPDTSFSTISAELKEWAGRQGNEALMKYATGPLDNPQAQAARWRLQALGLKQPQQPAAESSAAMERLARLM